MLNAFEIHLIHYFYHKTYLPGYKGEHRNWTKIFFLSFHFPFSYSTLRRKPKKTAGAYVTFVTTLCSPLSGLNLHGWVGTWFSESSYSSKYNSSYAHPWEKKKCIFILLFVYNIPKLLYLLQIIKNILINKMPQL